MVQLLVTSRTQRMTRRGKASFSFSVQGSACSTVRVVPARSDVFLDVTIRRRGAERGRAEVRASKGRKLRVGKLTLSLVATDEETGNTAAVDVVLVVESCLRWSEPAVEPTEDGGFNLTVEVSTACLPFKCRGKVSYHGDLRDGQVHVTVGGGPISLNIPIPLDGADFDLEDVQLTLDAGDGTTVSWQPGRAPEVTWAPPGPALKVPVAAGAGVAVAGLIALAIVLGQNGDDDPKLIADGSATRSTTTVARSSTTATSSSATTDPTTRTTDLTLPIVGPTLTVEFVDPPPDGSVGAPVEFEVAVKPDEPGGAPTREVELYDGTTVVDRGTPADGVVRLSFVPSTVGVHGLLARYVGDEDYEATASAPILVTIALASSSVVLESKVPADGCPPVTLAAKVKDEVDLVPTGWVAFVTSEDDVVRGTMPLVDGVANLTDLELPNGKHKVEARYSGDPLHTGDADGSVVELDCRPPPAPIG
jgi:hypothetical protein